MAIIYSYPTTTPVGADKILGVDSSDSNKTVVFTIDSILAAGSNAIVGTLTATGIGQFAGALRITESSTTQSLLIGNQDSAGANQPGMITGTNGNLGFGYGNSWVGEGGTFSETMTVSTDDRVGIGTANPTKTLHVNSGSTNEVALFESTDGNAHISFKDNTTSSSTHGIGAVGDNLTLYTNGGERIRIDSTGNTGIGNTSPASKLTVTGGDAEVDTVGKGFILKSPDGTRYRITVANGGALSASAV